MPRAILFASATATTGIGLRSSIRASHDPFGAPRREVQRITAVAPMTNNRRMPRCPIAISKRRLIGFDEAGVSFRYKDYRRDGADRQQVMRLATDEFIRRFLLHVLPHGFHRIRHYGRLAGSARKASLALARRLLEVTPDLEGTGPEEPVDPRPPCPCCGGRMIVIEIFERWCKPRAPPTTRPSNRETTP